MTDPTVIIEAIALQLLMQHGHPEERARRWLAGGWDTAEGMVGVKLARYDVAMALSAITAAGYEIVSIEPPSGLTDDEQALLRDLRETASGWTWWNTLNQAQKLYRKRLVMCHRIVDEVAEGWIDG